jgi:Cys-tRNA(Pro)/Cys-tRNA(Cys) deacylase
MKKEYPVFIHESCKDFDFIFISAGIRGMQIKLKPHDLIKAAKAVVCDILQ